MTEPIKVIAEDITATIRTLLNSAWKDLTPQKINSGQCADFADEVILLLELGGYEKLSWEWIPDMAHAAIPFQGKWFDAECPEGALAKDLPFWKRELLQEA